MGNATSGKDHKKDDGELFAAIDQTDEEQIRDIINNGKYSEMWQISEKQKALLREDWTILRSSLESVGVVTFLNLFETHPETLRPFIQDVYTVKELELNEWYREKLKVHALRVMAVVEKTMHRLDNEVKAGQILVPYGRRHKNYGVTPGMLEMMSYSFVVAIQPTLEEKALWSRDHEEAWLSIFRFIIFFLKLGYGGIQLILDERLKIQEEKLATTSLNESTIGS